ncbi:hypothetical protein E2562_020515 [Oryza meyeriana var. granulata]|uniref:Uncharacterized protein n=1 Tax=Oryza meyeriana var. granulata TaxID=110450 RepID=A0A6G1E9W3_9ORYZ|nr:hypothetical protein E2562_020515 [Oryza meyeriana var. granulata]
MMMEEIKIDAQGPDTEAAPCGIGWEHALSAATGNQCREIMPNTTKKIVAASVHGSALTTEAEADDRLHPRQQDSAVLPCLCCSQPSCPPVSAPNRSLPNAIPHKSPPKQKPWERLSPYLHPPSARCCSIPGG